ncbi:hypothetical protein ABW20_dc0104898 [Dactylellina cionopaga]|nr:hypothetical protein ABW20_dc0104898 [Dactylellina cionopaga]
MLLKFGQAGTPESLLEDLEDLIQGNRFLEFDESMEIFFKFMRLFKQVRIILDGIDECSNHSKEDIFKWIARTSSFSDSIIAVYVSSRKELEIGDKLKHFPKVSLAEAQPLEDLTNYIAEEVEYLKKKGSLKFKNGTLYDKVMERLMVKSDGMYRP